MGRAFIMLCLGEGAFSIGAALMSFALGVSVFEQRASVQQFSNLILASTVPSLVCMPVAGVLADSVDRRWVIASCDIAAALMTLFLAYLAFNQLLRFEHLFVFGAVGAVIGTLRRPAYLAAVAQMVPSDQLIRANGMMEMTAGFVQIGAPLGAGYLMATWGIESVIVAELVTAVAGACAILSAFAGASRAIGRTHVQVFCTPLESLRHSFTGVPDYFKSNPLMLSVLVYVLIQQALLVLVATMVVPLVLATHSSQTLSLVMALGALGGVMGAALLAGANVTRHLMLWIVACDAVLSAFVVLAGLTGTPALWGLCAFGAFACGSASEVCASALWMRKVPSSRQGGLFAAIGAGHLLVICMVMLFGSATVDQFLEPQMRPGAFLAEHLPWLGSGKGRGVALLFVLAGLTSAIVSLVALLDQRIWSFDRLVPNREEGAATSPLP
ncbi:MFS transporter [Paraburkholderia aspalathi]|uniref:MFS transporter n=1 Tax=Paraburkholderia aspalathi TaxID=1324617 RepID=UPI0038BC819A